MHKNLSDHKFIVIEGIDGVGKTTVAKDLSACLNAHYYKTPPSGLEIFHTPKKPKTHLSLRQFCKQFTPNQIFILLIRHSNSFARDSRNS